MNDRDKRNYYRLQDPCDVEFEPVKPSDLKNKNASAFFEHDPSLEILRELHELNMESNELLRNITRKDRQLGSFLHNLNKRIDLLGKGIGQKRDDHPRKYGSETQISEGGVSFVSRNLIDINSFLALKLIFHPSQLGILSFAVVKHCRLMEKEHAYRIGTEFIDLDNASQRLLARHIIQKQSAERRERLHRDGLSDH